MCMTSPAGLASLLSVRTLKNLNLSECLHVSGTEMVKGLKGSSPVRAQLESLNLKSCIYIRVRHVCTPCIYICFGVWEGAKK